MYYCFVDPFGRKDSGVTSYVAIARRVLKISGRQSLVIQRQQHESLDDFRKRVAREIAQRSDICMVEAPESLAATLKVDSTVPVHIKLHCAKSLGGYIQGQLIDQSLWEAEQEVIQSANFLSAPSCRAIVATKLLFDVRDDCAVIENPFPAYTPREKGRRADFDVIFVGRTHFLKGFNTFLSVARANPHWRFLAVLPLGSIAEWRLPSNLEVIQGISAWQSKIYHKARVLLVPSLFETASVVAAEAVAMGIPVVAMEEVGIVEYGEFPAICSVRSRDIDKISAALLSVLDSAELIDNSKIINNNNFLYSEFIRNLCDKNVAAGKNYLVDEYIKHAIWELPKMANNLQRSAGELTTFQRKLRKLRRDPALFFRDSKEFGFLFRIFDSIFKPALAVEKNQKTLPHAQNSVGVNVVSSKEEAILEAPKENEIRSDVIDPRLFVDIQKTGKISVLTPPDKPWGFVTGIMFSREVDSGFSEGLIRQLNGFDDFLPLSKEKLQIGFFADGGCLDSVDYINRIDLENKKRLAKISHLFVVDAPAALCEALRSCGTDTQLNLIVTDFQLLERVNPDVLDSIIILDDREGRAELPPCRKKISIADPAILPKTIRKIIQEAAPKRPNMLIPIFGFEEFARKDFLEFDSRNFQGIIRLSADFSFPGGQASAQDYYRAMAPHISGLALLDSVYLRYKEQLESGWRQDGLAKFLEFSLSDGNIFKIENV